MQTDTIQIPIEVIQGNTAALTQVDTALKKLDATSKTLNTNQVNLGQQFKRSWTELASGLNIAGQAFNSVQRAVSEITNTYIDYANQVRTISQVTGQSAEAVSRILQVTDDYKISAESLNVVMKKMAGEGFALSIDSLASLSDEYLTLNPGVERQIFLNEKFGRQGVAFAEIMLAGGAAIRSQSDAIAKGLILTQEGVDAAREYEKALDSLDEQKQALALTVGSVLVPAMAKWMDQLNTTLTVMPQMGNTFEDFRQAAIYGSESYAEYRETMKKFYQELSFSEEFVLSLTTDLSYLSEEEYNLQKSTQGVTGELNEAEMAARRMRDALLGIPTSVDVNIRVNTWQNTIWGVTEESALITQVGQMNYRNQDRPAASGYVPPTAYASGGSFSGWAMVGDSPGGGRTEFTEYVYAPHGAVVYNQSQMSGKSAPPMAGGGMIMPPSQETTLSRRSIQDLADAIGYKLAMVQ
jgi:hypothetical protein